ncbi:MAG: chemotaxis protein CheD [Dehalococcoidia bacterium]|nr:chemotaxis protein CheD [Dehalococcoidia bacterium]
MQIMIEVGMGKGIVASAPQVVSCLGIGSCVVIILYDAKRRIGGVAHIMLPDSNSLHNHYPPYQCADTAIATLLRRLRSMGAAQQDVVARMIGGARMFACSNGSGPGIGEQNIGSLRQILGREQIPLSGEEVGGSYGRNIEFYLDSGRVIVTTAGEKEDVEL